VAGRPKFYLLDFFPYPSGIGLHVGHPLGYIGTDVFGRYLRMTGHHVLHPFGFDTFGLPAEQYAIDTGQHSAVTVQRNADVIRQQLRRLGLGHDGPKRYRRELNVMPQWAGSSCATWTRSTRRPWSARTSSATGCGRRCPGPRETRLAFCHGRR
jgi:tRNA synthetases class I (M)